MANKTLLERVIDLECRERKVRETVAKLEDMVDKLYAWSKGARKLSELATMRKYEKAKK